MKNFKKWVDKVQPLWYNRFIKRKGVIKNEEIHNYC